MHKALPRHAPWLNAKTPTNGPSLSSVDCSNSLTISISSRSLVSEIPIKNKFQPVILAVVEALNLSKGLLGLLRGPSRPRTPNTAGGQMSGANAKYHLIVVNSTNRTQRCFLCACQRREGAGIQRSGAGAGRINDERGFGDDETEYAVQRTNDIA